MNTFEKKNIWEMKTAVMSVTNKGNLNYSVQRGRGVAALSWRPKHDQPHNTIITHI